MWALIQNRQIRSIVAHENREGQVIALYNPRGDLGFTQLGEWYPKLGERGKAKGLSQMPTMTASG